MRRFILFAFASLCLSAGGFSQEALLSAPEQYYDFLALQGYSERPYIDYRTLSDSKWDIGDASQNIWSGVNFGTTRRLTENIALKIYGPELFSSFNSAYPYGQNDGVLWQGRGLNASLSGGARLEAYGFELTLKPMLTFSQNLSFDLLPSAYASSYGYIWGYGYNAGADAPQRFGDASFFNYSWGDSEIRYTWETLTVGFGTQTAWIGPGEINSIIESNNASPYPKLDIGFRKTPITLFGWYAGDIESRLWVGQLTDSDYFDDGATPAHHLISGFTLAAAPSILPGLSLFFNRTYLAQWQSDSLNTIPSLLLFKFNNNGGDDSWDQRISLGFDYLLTKAGVEVYGEIGYNDNPGNSLASIIRNFSHTAVYTGGLRKAVTIWPEKKIAGELLFEWTNLEMSSSYSQFLWANSFYMHYQITSGYTNEGQWLGAGIGTGGNSQYLGLRIYYPEGSANIYIYRYNPDNDFLLRFTTPSAGYPSNNIYPVSSYKTIMAYGLQFDYYILKNMDIGLGFAYIPVSDPDYNGGWLQSTVLNNFRFEFGVKTYL